MKTLTQNFLKSLVDHKPNEVKDDIFKHGFKIRVIKPGVAVIMILVEDLVDLSVDTDGFIVKASTCDPRQTLK